MASLEVSISPFKVTVPPTDVVVTPPLKVCVPPDAPNTKVPSLAGVNEFVTDDPLPVKATLATVLSTVNDSASTSPENVVVPATLVNVSAPTLLIAPDAVISAPVSLSSLDNVRFCEPTCYCTNGNVCYVSGSLNYYQ